ncbi:hypothetical protein DBR28_21280 [Chryseobacterium sp. HMWF028]|nr:hypothetical protein DBR28_21280 [Chryseobacterium sp. HMWF028]
MLYSQVGINTPQPNSTLVVEGSYEGAFRKTITNTTLSILDQYITAEGSSPLTITLPDGIVTNPFFGRVYYIKNNTTQNLTISGFGGTQLLKIDGTTNLTTYTVPAGSYVQVVKNMNATITLPLWDLSFVAASLPGNVKSLQYSRTLVSPIDANTPNNSVVHIGNLNIGYNGTTAASSGTIEYQLNVSSPVTVWYKKAGTGGTNLDVYGQTAAMAGYWYKLAYQTADNGNNINPANRDASETILIVHATKEVYRITSNVNGDIAASGSVPAVQSAVTLFVEKLD